MREVKTGIVRATRHPCKSRVFEAKKREIKDALARGTRPVNPRSTKLESSKTQTLAAWCEVAKNRFAAGNHDLAISVTYIAYEADKFVASQVQHLYD